LISLEEGGGFYLDPGTPLMLVSCSLLRNPLRRAKPYFEKYTPLEATTYAIWAGAILTLVLLPGLPDALEAAPLETSLIMVYLGLVPTALAYVAYAYSLSRKPASRTASFLYLVPTETFLVAWSWLSEVPKVFSVVGGVFTLAGVLLVNRHAR
jgi:drug/metabolite transporter (DMT)-like permease